MPAPRFDIRPATLADLPAVARLAAVMVRLHHGWDAQRFAIFREPIEPGYESWLAQELENRRAVVLVAAAKPKRAQRAGKSVAAPALPVPPAILGYAYARLEGRDWNRLLEACGFLHDLVVAEEARQHGVASALVEAVADWMTERRAPRLLLETAAGNELAQGFFRKRGFRPTMIEMTRELENKT